MRSIDKFDKYAESYGVFKSIDTFVWDDLVHVNKEGSRDMNKIVEVVGPTKIDF
jgi:hypothetical protein